MRSCSHTPRPILLFDVKKCAQPAAVTAYCGEELSSAICSLVRYYSCTRHSFRLCLTTGPQPLPKPGLHTVRSSSSSFNLQNHLFSLWSSTSCLRLHSRLPVNSILPSIFPWLDFLLLMVCRIFHSSLTLCSTSSFPTSSVQLIFSILLQHHISKLARYFWCTSRSVQVSASYKATTQIQYFADLVFMPIYV